jgi:methyl-accepting chemotaxis protein
MPDLSRLFRLFFPKPPEKLEISGIIAELDEVMTRVEPRFLKVGRELQNLFADSRILSDRTQEAVGFIESEENSENFLDRIDRLTRHSLEALRGYQDKIGQNLNSVNRSLEHLGRLCSICSVIEKTGMTLNVIGLNIAVESSRSPESGEMFSVFTEEIRQLSRKIAGISQSILEGSGTTRSDQMAAHDKIVKGLEVFEDLYASAEKVVQGAIEEIYRIMEMSVKVMEISHAHSSEISRQVGEVVVALQFHDIARQKIEHIILALKDAETLLTARPASDTELQESGKQANDLLKLQAIQLGEVVTDIRGSFEKSSIAFEGLGRQVHELVSGISQFESGNTQGHKVRKSITILKSGLEQLGLLLEQGKFLELQIKQTSEQVANTASQLSDHIDQVRAISRDLHLKALNAVVKSARLPEEGRTLEILAQEVSTLSRQSHTFVNDVVIILQALVELSLGLDLDSFDESGLSESDVEASLQAGVEELTLNYENYMKNTSEALEMAKDMHTAISETSKSLEFIMELAEELNWYRNKIDRLIDTLFPHPRPEDSVSGDKLDQAARRYTMKSERRLHHQYLGDGEAFELAANEEKSEELFEEFSLDPSDPILKPDVSGEFRDVDDHEDSEGADLFQDRDTESPANSNKKQEDKESLGDNVELF